MGFNYHGRMKKLFIGAFCSLCLAGHALLAQTMPPPSDLSQSLQAPSSGQSELDAELFYRLLIGEITARDGDAAAAYALMLDSARKTNDAQLYQRAVEIALQSRSGDAALQAALAWRQAQPANRDPNRYVLQILIALNRIQDTLEPVKKGVELSTIADRSRAISAIPTAYARVTDKKLAATVVETALETYLINPSTTVAAWTTVGRMRLAAGNTEGALDAARKGQAADPQAEGPALIALEMMNPQQPAAEAVVKKYLTQNPKAIPDIRMAYARALLDAMRYGEATAELQMVIKDKPDFAPAWLVLGSLQLQDNQLALAQASLERYVSLSLAVQQKNDDDEPDRGLAQAYLSLAQIAEKRKDFNAAEGWLGKIENSADMMQAQTRRASILASRGQLTEGRQLIRSLPASNCWLKLACSEI